MAAYEGYTTLYDYMVHADIPDGDHTIDLNGVIISIEMINKIGDYRFDGSETIGNTIADQHMLILRVDGDLTIQENTILQPLVRKKGMFLFAKGNIINNGTISMTARGAIAAGQDIQVAYDNKQVLHVIPAIGGTGAPAVSAPYNSFTTGVKGSSKALSTGGGGSGAAMQGQTRYSVISGKGGNGTSYSGGSGGGGISSRYTATAGTGSPTGGPGGNGYAKTDSQYYYMGGGGAGNPGGTGAKSSGSGTAQAGEVGTGGLLILAARNITNHGTIESKGSKGGSTSGGNNNGTQAGGGGSGGGLIVMMYTTSTSGDGLVTAQGGAGGVTLAAGREGGAGGDGDIVKMQVGENFIIVQQDGKLYYVDANGVEAIPDNLLDYALLKARAIDASDLYLLDRQEVTKLYTMNTRSDM